MSAVNGVNGIASGILRTAIAWWQAGHRVTLVTLVKTWGSAPRPVGSLLAICEDGRMVGSISGGCVEDDLLERVQSREVATSHPELLTYGVTREQTYRFGLPCGGTLRLVVEPLIAIDNLQRCLRGIEKHRLMARTLTIATGDVHVGQAARDQALIFDEETLTTVLGPSWRLLIIGAGDLAHYLAQMATMLDYRVTICDPREYASETWHLPEVEYRDDMPDDAVRALKPDQRTAIVALTHDPKLDDLALLEALISRAFYVGALGSRANNNKRRARLATFDLTPADIARLHGPVGLAIGSRTPPEIAVSIVAQMTEARWAECTPRGTDALGGIDSLAGH